MSILWAFRQHCSHILQHHLTFNTLQSIAMANVHTRARKSPYAGTEDVHRIPVSDGKVPWNVSWPDYKPTEYTERTILKKPSWADDADPKKIQHFNQLDGKIDRRSAMGEYDIDQETNRPKNPQGRTGLSGRGLLGRWGPNHAGDPVVTRWAQTRQDTKHKILEVILISRKDNGYLALPGGMVDPGEQVFATIKREFIEEAMNSNSDSAKQVDALFKKADSVYRGYIDDPRNTDNAWIESEAMNAHDETGELTKDLKLEGGDDAVQAQWVQLDRNHNLHASHESIIQQVIKKHGAYEYWHGNSSSK